MKYLIIISILICRFAYPQVNDSTKTLIDVKIPSTIIDTTKVNSEDSLKHKAAIDTLMPVYQRPLDGNSFIIPGIQISKMDYRYAGDLLNDFDFNFTLDRGFIGQPNETTIYGTGFKGISYLEDGILINNRFTNSLDLNLVQTENIDSIEIVPLPRGFLYGPYNNNVSVNFITKDFLSRPPYSRIKYYQGPNGEALIDVLFNTWMYKRFIAFFDISNRKTEDNYLNSSFSLWQARLKLKYLLSDKINIIGAYYYSTSQTGLNGGVNYAQIDSTTKDINSVLYDPQLAPVIYSTRAEQIKQQDVSLKLLGKFTDNSSTNLILYYRSNFDAITGEAPTGSSDSTYFANTDRNKIYGASLQQDFNTKELNLSVIGNYEKYELNYDALFQNAHPQINYNSFVYSLSAVASFNPGNKIFIPSVFYKISHNSYLANNNSSSGLGMDIKSNLNDDISAYAGVSFYKNQNGTNSKIFEASGEFNNDFISVGLRYFSRRSYYLGAAFVPNPLGERFPYLSNTDSPLSVNYTFPSIEQNMDGIGGHLNFKLWKIIWENSAAHYFNADNSGILLSLVPKYTYRGGLYYKGLLFHDNLDLKAGIVFYYTGERNDITNSTYGTVTVDPTNRFDFTFAGEIQKVAIVYFAWENLFNKLYYVVPYYPMPTRNIRFGLAWELFN
jgi:TonB-dependent Receptor Plug Domain